MMRYRMMLGFVIVAFLTVLGIGHTLAGSTPAAAGSSVGLAAGTPEASGAWILAAQTATEENQKPAYTITVNKPTLETSDGKASAFNKAVDDFVASATGDFKKSVQDAENAPGPDGASALDIGYDVYATHTGLISVKFSVYFYVGGSAHPADYSSSLNYNLATGQVLTLAGLFKPGAKYLDVIANYCIQGLKQQNKLTFPEGAAPKAENYARWNLDRGGLVITFDTYQVGSRVEGPSEILVPYSVLADLLKPDGPVVP